ncbi:hypothetical protein F441_13344 [Phytophthora nicotianae CJ01A1]|uniref:NADH:flavin oxidoreductase/NADH oxidase N-terminal domain-containing protein n=1 Tax=Phytophthora nicotianae CJ01A1 TaxID=1317063 RepID=W2WNF9_PHYNI|nr:hypothetical protein F441_13344 [Phytophthora nicotianae CJ01A1]
MAPLGRLHTGEDGAPTDLVVEYCAQRATDGGLIIAEATNISPTARHYFGGPGLFSQDQIKGWKLVTKSIQDKGGKVFVQRFHSGRVGNPLHQPYGQLPVSSSAARPQPQQFQVIYILDKVLGLVVGGALSKTTTAAGLP